MRTGLLSLAVFFGLSAVASGCGGTGSGTTAGSAGSAGSGAQGGGGSMTGGSGGSMTTGGSGGSMTTGGSGGSMTTGGSGGSMTTGGSGGSVATGGSGGGMVGPGATLAIHKLLIGDTLPNGQPSPTAWKGYGFDIDGKVSTAQSVDLCKPAAGATPAAVYPDGDNGIDNGFGKNVLPILTSLAADLSTQVNASINAGEFTVLVHIDGLGAGATGTFTSEAFTGQVSPNPAPAWNGMDKWHVRSDCLLNGNLTTPIALFPMSQVTVDAGGQRVYTSISGGDITLLLGSPLGGLAIPIRDARISMVLSNDNAKGTSGMIGGIIDTQAFINELAKLAGSFDPTLCPPSPTFQSIAQQVMQAQDILLDGSQDPAKTCDGISIGLGFEADAALLDSVFTPPVVPDPCP